MKLRTKKILKRRLMQIFTFNKYYICGECGKIHKKNGTELESKEWIDIICRECYDNTMNKISKIFNDMYEDVKVKI